MRSTDGSELGFTVRSIGTQGESGAGVRILTPVAPLEPNTKYELWSCPQLDCNYPVGRFTTSNASDITPPQLPTIVGRSSDAGRNCGSSCGSPWASSQITLDHEGVLVVDLNYSADNDPFRPGGHVFWAVDEGEVRFTIGCQGLWPAEAGQSLPVRFGAYDLAGNFSGWTEWSVMEMPSYPIVCGCATARGTRLGPILLLTLVFLLWRRRQRPRSY